MDLPLALENPRLQPRNISQEPEPQVQEKLGCRGLRWLLLFPEAVWLRVQLTRLGMHAGGGPSLLTHDFCLVLQRHQILSSPEAALASDWRA